MLLPFPHHPLLPSVFKAKAVSPHICCHKIKVVRQMGREFGPYIGSPLNDPIITIQLTRAAAWQFVDIPPSAPCVLHAALVAEETCQLLPVTFCFLTGRLGGARTSNRCGGTVGRCGGTVARLLAEEMNILDPVLTTCVACGRWPTLTHCRVPGKVFLGSTEDRTHVTQAFGTLIDPTDRQLIEQGTHLMHAGVQAEGMSWAACVHVEHNFSTQKQWDSTSTAGSRERVGRLSKCASACRRDGIPLPIGKLVLD